MAIDFKKFNPQLSGESFTLKPQISADARPPALEADDRLFDPALDTVSHLPQSIGHLCDRFAIAHGSVPGASLTIPIKKRGQDIYYVPQELAAYSEFIQKSIDFEHAASQASIERIAFLKISRPHFDSSRWHFDVNEDSRHPVRTYCCSDKNPTRYAQIAFQPERASFAYTGDNAFAFMLAAAGFERRDDAIHALQEFSAASYEITRHNGMSVHRGYSGDDRTLMSLHYNQI